MHIMKSRRPLLPLAVLVVLGELTVASECDFFIRLLSAFILSGILLYFLICKRISRSAAALLLLMPALSILRYETVSHSFRMAEQRISLFKEQQIRLHAIVTDVIPTSTGTHIYLEKTLLNSAYGNAAQARAMIQKGHADASILARFDQPIEKTLVHFVQTPAVSLTPGQTVDIYGTAMPSLPASNPGQFDFRLAQRARGISCSVLGKRVVLLSDDSRPFPAFLTHLRNRITIAIRKCFSPEDAGIYEALLTGQKGEMEEHLRSLYQKSGISHILAVSGLHLSILGTGFYMLLRRCGAGYRTAGCLASLVIVSYGILTGCSGSALRAVIMLLLRFLSPVVGKTYDMLSAVAASVILLLLWSPYLLFTSGFQLSFLAVTALALYPELPHPKHHVLSALFASLLLQAFSLPVMLHSFFRYPLYGILLNFLVLPLMSLVFYSGFLAVSAVLLGFPSVGLFFAGGGHYILKLYTLLSECSLRLPFGSLLLGSPTLHACAVYYCVLLSLCLLGLHKRLQEKRRRTIILWHPLLITAILLANVFFLLPAPPQNLRIVSVDVGQGDGFVLRQQNTVVTIDLGSSSNKKIGKNVIAPYLLSQGIDYIDTAILTHSDMDHTNGILYILTETDDIRIGRLMLPAPAEKDKRYDAIRNAAEEKHVPVQYLSAGDRLHFSRSETLAHSAPESRAASQTEPDTISLTCLYPVDGQPETDANRHSIGLLLCFHHFHMLFTGDMDQSCEEKMLSYIQMQKGSALPVKLDVLKAGHHGSSTSSSEALLDYFQPEYALLSYGAGNDYGHPHQETLEKLKARNIKRLETARSGAITIETDGQQRSVSFFRNVLI